MGFTVECYFTTFIVFVMFSWTIFVMLFSQQFLIVIEEPVLL